MWQRDAIQCMAPVFDAKFFPNKIVERRSWQELGNGQFSNRKHELRFQQFNFGGEPTGAMGDLVFLWDTVPARLLFSGETTTHGGEVNAVAGLVFRPTERFIEPLEECLARRPRKGPTELGFFITWRLANQ